MIDCTTFMPPEAAFFYPIGEFFGLGTTHASPLHGPTTLDVCLNGNAFWRNVPAAVWNYRLGGYQVLKKWLSYREGNVFGRVLSPEEVHHFAETARRIGGLILATYVDETGPEIL